MDDAAKCLAAAPARKDRSAMTDTGGKKTMTTYDPDAILADPDAHPIHKMCAEINIAIRDRGEHWSKCYECGDPYQITEAWRSRMFCCQEHEGVGDPLADFR